MTWSATLNDYALPNVTNVESSVQTLFTEHNYERDTPPLAEWGGFNAPALWIEGIAELDAQFAAIQNFLGTSPLVVVLTPDSNGVLTVSENYLVENIEWNIEGGYSQAHFKYKMMLVKTTGGVNPPEPQTLSQSACLVGPITYTLGQSARLQNEGGGPYYLQIVLGHGSGVVDPTFGQHIYDKGVVVDVTVLENEEHWLHYLLDGVNQGEGVEVIHVTVNADHTVTCFWSTGGPE